MRGLLVLPLVLLASPTLAETVRCSDSAGEVVVAFDVERQADVGQVSRVEMQIAGDIGISTDPLHEDYSGEDIAASTVASHFVEVILRVANGPPALILRVVDADHGDTWLRAGVLSVAGGGVWVVTCDAPV